MATKLCIMLTVMVARPSIALRLSRREVVAGATGACSMLSAGRAVATGNVVVSPDAGAGAKLDGSVKAAKTPEAAKAQLVSGYGALGKLLDNYDAVIASEGGDGIRRVLGTVGTASPCYLVEPAFRLLFEADESLPMEVRGGSASNPLHTPRATTEPSTHRCGSPLAAQYIEGVEKIMVGLSSADGDAYSANFITFSSAKGKPEDYYKRARTTIVKAREEWKEVMGMVGLKP